MPKQCEVSQSPRCVRALPGLCTAWLLIFLAAAGTPNAQAGDDARPDLNGVWISVLVAFDDPRWRIADLVCARAGCSVESYAYLQGLLVDPANKNRTTKHLVEDMNRFQQEANQKLLTPAARKSQAEFDPSQEAALDCKPDGDGLRHQILAPLPLQIEQHDDKVILRYEYWNAERTVYLDQDGHPQDGAPSRLGHSTGRYEGSTLIVETAQMLPSETGIPNDKPLTLSAEARTVERYTLTDEGQAMDVTLDIIDPVNFTGPMQSHRRMLIAPGWELDKFECESLTGQY
ncbi:MAG: hypothetical protein EXR85_05550 [Xanthomonadales bacterium]|nr:hypothetical protein [Xanthomonadales bacterium]